MESLASEIIYELKKKRDRWRIAFIMSTAAWVITAATLLEKTGAF